MDLEYSGIDIIWQIMKESATTFRYAEVYTVLAILLGLAKSVYYLPKKTASSLDEYLLSSWLDYDHAVVSRLPTHGWNKSRDTRLGILTW